MAVQAVMRRWRSGVGSDDETDFVKPVGVVGVEGIYDLVGLRDRHADESVYEEIVVNAFGPDERVWEAASPTGWLRGKHIAGLAEAWPEGRLLLVAHSPEDELVEKEQATGLLQVLGLEGNASQQRRDEILWINGKHDQVWEEGVELTRAISRAIELLHAT
ncbi:MAG: hypothetical protein M1832_005217 [Thelocarpon impressellum]|nr:MAG: hypothetical protein M1832_005217 [Thelocarpon impressellum]